MTLKAIKSNQNTFYYCLLLIISITSFVNLGCKKVEYGQVYPNSYLYISNYIKPYSPDYGINYFTTRKYNFNFFEYGTDTIQTNSTIPFVVPNGNYSDKKNHTYIYTVGSTLDVDRPFKLKVEGDGKDFVILPPEDSLKIPAGKIGRNLIIRFKRPPVSDTTIKTAFISVVDNEYFTNYISVDNSKISFEFGNFFSKNPWEDLILKAQFGEKITEAKMSAINNAINEKGSEYWQSYVTPVNTILNDPKNSSFNYFGVGRRLNLNPFTVDDWVLAYQIKVNDVLGSQLNSFYAEVAKVAKAYLEKKKAEGAPVKDAEGNEVTLP